jgi:hypothetical protein
MLDALVAAILITAFVLTLMHKWGLVDTITTHTTNDFVYRLFKCDFCLSFWVSMLVCVILFWSGMDVRWFTPIMVAPAVRAML